KQYALMEWLERMVFQFVFYYLHRNLNKKEMYHELKREKNQKFEYFQDNLEDLHSNKVYIDPNKRDYTQMQRRKESELKRSRKIRERYQVATEEVVNYEITKKTLDKTKWNDYM
ncbi:hypothetical protein HK099_005917, partial [Clydaea vesicula]